MEVRDGAEVCIQCIVGLYYTICCHCFPVYCGRNPFTQQQRDNDMYSISWQACMCTLQRLHSLSAVTLATYIYVTYRHLTSLSSSMCCPPSSSTGDEGGCSKQAKARTP